MKATLERSHLLKSLGHVHRVVERRNTIPILSNVLIKSAEGNVELKATDLDLEVVEHVPAMVEQTGATTVPAHILHDIIRKLPDGVEVSLDTGGSDGTMALSAGKSRFTLQMLPDSEFPDITAGEFSHTFSLDAKELKKLIDRTQFAISTEETRYYLNGIYLHAEDQAGELVLRAVATDGHRLALADIPAPTGCENMPGIIVPRKAVGEIQKLLDGSEERVQVELSDSKIRITLGSVVLTSKLIDGTFPDYERVIPRNNDRELRLDRATFEKAVDRVSTISSERGRAVKLSLSEDQLVLSVTNPDSGTATEELSVQYAAEGLDIGFNAKYLLDIASQLQSDAALFKFSDPGMPTLVCDEADPTTLFVLMPMRV